MPLDQFTQGRCGARSRRFIGDIDCRLLLHFRHGNNWLNLNARLSHNNRISDDWSISL